MNEVPIEKAALDALIEIAANGVRYRGKISRVNSLDGKITLHEVSVMKNQELTPVAGQMHFFRDDIQSITFIDEEAVLRRMDPNYLVMKPFRKPVHLIGNRQPTDEDILKLCRPSDGKAAGDAGEEFRSASTYSQVIDSMDDDFKSSISLLKAHKALAVAAQGVVLSRNGELCWLAVATPTHAFLFDMVSLGEKAFEDGLADIFQSSGIIKVIHDCRFLSDYLFHKHKIFLQNVWDTQVARIVVYKHHHCGDMPRFVDSLPKTLQDALGVDPNEFPILWYRSYALEEDQAVWRQRPLPEELQNVLEYQVKYLLQLRIVLLEKLMAELTIGVDIYMKSVRDARKSSVDSMVKSSFLVPCEFQRMLDGEKERYERGKSKSRIDPLTGFRESMGQLAYWKVRFSRDAWHGRSDQKGGNESKEDEIPEQGSDEEIDE